MKWFSRAKTKQPEAKQLIAPRELTPEERAQADETARGFYEREARRKALHWAIRTRVLTDAEMAEVMDLDYQLTVRLTHVGHNCAIYETYNEQEKQREFNDLLYQQARLRALLATGSDERRAIADQPSTEQSGRDRREC